VQTVAKSHGSRSKLPFGVGAPVATGEHDPLHQMTILTVVVLVFLKFGIISEVLSATIGHSLYVLYIFVPPAFIGLVATGGLRRVFQHRLTWIWVAFYLWILIGTPFSSWRGSSAMQALYYLRDHLSMLIFIGGAVQTWRHCRLIFGAILAAALVDLVFVRFTGGVSADRFALEIKGTIANANDLAAHLLVLVPFLVYFLTRPKTKFIFRLMLVPLIGFALLTILRTGSRGGLLATAAGGIVYLYTAPVRQRIMAAFVLPIAGALLLLAVPQDTYIRLMSFSATETSSEEALLSKASREYLLRKSIEFTLENPVFGVGLSQFTNYEGTTSREAGELGNWHETHNAYTQVSSECGIPALIFYLAAIAVTFRILLRTLSAVKKAGHTEMTAAVTCVAVSFASFCVAIIFLSMAYRFYIPAFSGFALALQTAAASELRLLPPGRRA
jgi:O-antigen ligase